jgi:hypothetical protein
MKQHHKFLGMLESLPPKCGGQKDDGSGVCYGREEDHQKPDQAHLFVPAPEYAPDFLKNKCAGVKDNSNALCALPETAHIKPAKIGELNPYLEIEVDRLLRNLQTDYKAASDMAKQYRAWAQLKNSSDLHRTTNEYLAQVWEARVNALGLALSGFQD